MITGTVPILAVWFFASAHLLTCVQQVRYYVNQGRWSLLKLRSPWVVAMICAMFIPENGIQTGFFAGLSVLAIVSAMDMTNGGLYASLMNQYGTKEESGAFVLMSPSRVR